MAMPGEGVGSRALHRLQDRLLHLLGSDVARRANVVQAMLHRDANESVSYWLQLVVSIGIATLGLVVGSTAVIIGAMLVAPLMSPIVGLAMGLATGSPFLVLRSGGRILLSITVAVGGAALITLLLPFHELNSEIAARTTPTVLDLLTAAFCALAGVYAALRPGSDTASTAAGTSIGISLVPPLCASGYGFGTMAWSVAGGAGLLFLTNLVAIVAVGGVAFVAVGFNRVDATTLEREELAEGQDAPIARRLARRLASLFESRSGPLLRFAMPFLLLAAVYVPLRRALDEVAWEVAVRRAVRDALAREPLRIIESKAQVARHTVDVVVVLVGRATDAHATRSRLSQQIERVAQVKPSIEVLAVPDATAFAGLESTLLTPRAAPVAPPVESLTQQVQQSGARIRAALLEAWPAETAGAALSFSIEPTEAGPARLHVTHLGPPLPASAREAIERALESKLEDHVELVDIALPSEPIRRNGNDTDFIARVAGVAHDSRTVTATTLCLTRPDAVDKEAALPTKDVNLAKDLDGVLDDHPRVVTTAGKEFVVRIVSGACPASGEEAAPAREPSKSVPQGGAKKP